MSYFTPKTFQFLRDLSDNNSREWFKANQDRYEEHVREPALDFIADFSGALEQISPHFVADTRKVGGSLFRIQRDTRFSSDKTPYKINTGMHFRHQRAKDAHAPGFYVHLEPRNCFMGVGLWRPETKVAYAIRDQIAAEPKMWRAATRSKKFADLYTLGGDSLTRPPKGFDADHPLIDDLKRKDFIASAPLTQKAATSSSFLNDFAVDCKRAVPFMRFLCDAVGVSF
jgi:uncharacterized protein (TIGR02453 family)